MLKVFTNHVNYFAACSLRIDCLPNICRIAIQRLEITKNDLRQRIAKEVFSLYDFLHGLYCNIRFITFIIFYDRHGAMLFYKVAWREGSRLYMRDAWPLNKM